RGRDSDRCPSGDLVGAPAAPACPAGPGSRHLLRPVQLALVLRAHGDGTELDLLATDAAVDGVLATGIRELDRPVQRRARLLPANREVARNRTAVVAFPLPAELQLNRCVRPRGGARGERRAAAGENEKSGDPESGKPSRDRATKRLHVHHVELLPWMGMDSVRTETVVASRRSYGTRARSAARRIASAVPSKWQRTTSSSRISTDPR